MDAIPDSVGEVDTEAGKRIDFLHRGVRNTNGEDRSQAVIHLLEWENDLRRQPEWEYTTDVFQYILDHNEGEDLWKWDHLTLKEALVGRGMMDDVRYHWNKGAKKVISVWTLGHDMVGHPKIVHGGATAFAFDETFGMLYASLNFGPGFTAHLGVDYRKPFPANTTGCLEAVVERIDRRKVFLKATLRSEPNGSIFAESDALYIVAKKSEG